MSGTRHHTEKVIEPFFYEALGLEIPAAGVSEPGEAVALRELQERKITWSPHEEAAPHPPAPAGLREIAKEAAVLVGLGAPDPDEPPLPVKEQDGALRRGRVEHAPDEVEDRLPEAHSLKPLLNASKGGKLPYLHPEL